MKLSANVFDAWVFRKTDRRIECLLLYTSQQKADRYFNGGRFWQTHNKRLQRTVVDKVPRHEGQRAAVEPGRWA
jgi:hypothetical protein